jgi:hypothetical protein
VKDRVDQLVDQGELQDAAIKAMRGAMETSDREKVTLLMGILAEASTRDRPPRLDLEAVVDELVRLSPLELGLAREIFDGVEAARGGIHNPPVAANPDLDFHLLRLSAAGLITTTPAQVPSYRGYTVTPTFRRIIRMARHQPAEN